MKPVAETVWVKAREGVRVPCEGAPRSHISGEPVAIILSPYYRRQIADGDLVMLEPS